MKIRSLIIVLLFPSLIIAQSKLAIVDCNLAGVEYSYQQIIIEMLIEEYKSSTNYNVLSYDNVHSVIQNKGLESSRLNKTQMIEIAKELDADFVGFGSVAKFGETYTFTFKILDVFQENEVFSQNKRFNLFDEFPEIIKINSKVKDSEDKLTKNVSEKKVELPSVYFDGVLYVLPYIYYEVLTWSPVGKNKIPTGAKSLTDGEKNTELIVKSYGEGDYAAKVCYDLDTLGFSDWYLPAKDELTSICDKKEIIGGYNKDYMYYYWSSSELKSGTAWVRMFQGCIRASSKKSDPRPFTCVRRD